jgi:hypothetical protein
MFTVQMPNQFDSMFNMTWLSPYFRNFSQEWNPWGDASIARIQLMRFNLARSCAIYDSEMRSLYWNHLTFEDQLYAEAQFDYYKSMHDFFAEKEIAALASRYLEKESALLDANWQPVGRAAKQARESIPENITYSDWMRGMLRFDAPFALTPPSMPGTYRFQQALLEPGRYEMRPIIPKDNEPAFFARWRNHQAYNQLNLNISSNMWAYDLRSAQPLNQLKGVSANTHLLLTNQNIPLPNNATFLAWYTICGFGCEKLTPADARGLTRLCGFTPRILLTYIVPMIPRTKEHAAHAVVATDDSHSDHSLPSRSSGHLRDSHGRINYGTWVVRSVLVGNDDGKIRMHTVAHHWLDDATQAAIGFHYRAKQMLPWTGYLANHSHDAIWARPMLTHVTSFLMDPYQANRDPMRVPIHNTRNADLGMRAVSKQLGAHFRFDSWESAEDWCIAFELCAYHQMLAGQNGINKSFFEAIMGLTVIPSGIKEKRKFNLDSLDGAV